MARLRPQALACCPSMRYEPDKTPKPERCWSVSLRSAMLYFSSQSVLSRIIWEEADYCCFLPRLVFAELLHWRLAGPGDFFSFFCCCCFWWGPYVLSIRLVLCALS